MGVLAAPPRTLAEIEDLGSGVSFPGQALSGSKTALCLFCAAWHGRQDAYWVAKAGLTATCVDVDGNRLVEMADIYPPDWTFLQRDAFAFAYETDVRQWDVVTLDPFTNLIPKCAEEIELWCSLARHVVVLGSQADTEIVAPDGWDITERRRRSDFKGGIDWVVLTSGRASRA